MIALLGSAVRATHVDTDEDLLIWGFSDTLGGFADAPGVLVQNGAGFFHFEGLSYIRSNYRFDPDREASGQDGWHDLKPPVAPPNDLGDEDLQ